MFFPQHRRKRNEKRGEIYVGGADGRHVAEPLGLRQDCAGTIFGRELQPWGSGTPKVSQMSVSITININSEFPTVPSRLNRLGFSGRFFC